MSSGDFGVVGAQGGENFAGKVALLAPDDFGHGEAFGGAAGGVGAGAGVVAQADDDCDVQGAVAGSVAAAVQPVAVGLRAG